MAKNINVLDCTLRDGAHVNGGNFGKKVIKETIRNLVNANVDIIEVGFFDNNEHDDNSTFFSSVEDVKKVLPTNRGSSKFSLMADFVDVSTVEPCDGTIEFFRLSFKRHRLDWGLNAAKILMEKGYKCYINPVNCNVYTAEQYLDVLHKVNELHPYGFSIVDTFGVMRKSDLTYFYSLAENTLSDDITIGVHLHENLGLAYSLAQHFLEISNPKRNISIDGSLLGMGRVPGNLCVEQIMDHLNYQYGKGYHTEYAFDAIDDYIAPIKKEIPWGYSVAYALSGRYGLHRTYAEYLLGKNRLKTKDIQRILSMVDKQHIEMFDEAYIENLYRTYIERKIDDEAAFSFLSEYLQDQTVLVICPGSTISEYQDKIVSRVNAGSTKIISVNFVPEFIKPDAVFCANAKRVQNIRNIKEICKLGTSNVTDNCDKLFDYIFSFSRYAYFNEEFCEDSTLILLNVLVSSGVRTIEIAGFDGFSNGEKNYYLPDYTREVGKTISVEKVRRILAMLGQDVQVNFITPSAYNTEKAM